MNEVDIKLPILWITSAFKDSYSKEEMKQYARDAVTLNLDSGYGQSRLPKAYHVEWEDIGEGTALSLFYDENARENMLAAISHGLSIGRGASITPLYTKEKLKNEKF
jgi:hypothetical protein